MNWLAAGRWLPMCLLLLEISPNSGPGIKKKTIEYVKLICVETEQVND